MTVDKAYREEVRKKTSKPLLWLGIVSIVMFFGALTSGMVVKMAESSWIDIDMPPMFFVSTGVIVLSSITLQIAYMFAKRDKQQPMRAFLLTTLILGLMFGVGQFLGWKELIASNIYPSGPTSSPNAQFVYALTFFHLLHIVGGWVSLIIVNFKAGRGKYNSKNLLGLQLSATYWHFLDILWIYIFVFLSIYS